MANQNDTESFSPDKFVKGLSPEQLESLSELAAEANEILTLVDTNDAKTYEAPTGKEMLQVFQAAEREILTRLAPQLDPEDIEQAPQWRNSDGEPEKRIPKNPDSEWLREIGHELEEKRKGLVLPAIPSHKEIQALLDFYNDHPRNQLMMRVLYASGIRREELVNLLVADIYFEENIIFVREGKYDKDRYVLIDQGTSDLLKEYTKNFLYTDHIFDISKRTVNRVVNDASEGTGLRQRFAAMGRKFTVHTLRHCYASHMHASGAGLFVLKTLLGHLNLKVTKTYIHIGVEAFSDRYNKYHPLAQETKASSTSPDLEDFEQENND